MKYLVLALILAGCAAKPLPRPEPIVTTIEVKVPIAAPCVPMTLKDLPDYVDSAPALRAAADAAERLQLLYAGRAQREARLNEIEPILAACPRG